MAALTVFTTDIRVEIPELPGFVAERSLIRAAREFCEETRCWRVNITIDVTADDPTVDIAALLPAGTELVDIVSVKNVLGGAPVTATTYTKLDRDSSDWRTDTDLNAKLYVLDGNNVVRFFPTPSTTVVGKYYMRVAVKPTQAATTIDDVVANKYNEALIHGALASLYRLPRKPWTDLNLSSYHATEFRTRMPAARTESAEEFQTGVARSVKYGGL